MARRSSRAVPPLPAARGHHRVRQQPVPPPPVQRARGAPPATPPPPPASATASHRSARGTGCGRRGTSSPAGGSPARRADRIRQLTALGVSPTIGGHRGRRPPGLGDHRHQPPSRRPRDRPLPAPGLRPIARAATGRLMAVIAEAGWPAAAMAPVVRLTPSAVTWRIRSARRAGLPPAGVLVPRARQPVPRRIDEKRWGAGRRGSGGVAGGAPRHVAPVAAGRGVRYCRDDLPAVLRRRGGRRILHRANGTAARRGAGTRCATPAGDPTPRGGSVTRGGRCTAPRLVSFEPQVDAAGLALAASGWSSRRRLG